MKRRVILFQPYVRPFVLNFGKYLKQFTFLHIATPRMGRGSSVGLPSFEKEFKRNKRSVISVLRRIFGIPNIRFRFDKEGDAFFTYGSLVIGSKPYIPYIETGVALYGYDNAIARNPIAQFLVGFLASRPNCLRLVFLSEAGKKSFFATVKYPLWLRQKLEAKSVVIYPIPIAPPAQEQKPKKMGKTLKLLFPGTFYIKGGIEVAHAYETLRKRHGAKVSLTIVTALHMIRPDDRRYLESLPGLNLVDAKLNEQEMIRTYQEHDVFLLPTFREGFGLVLIEALAYGLPVVITDQYATAEMAKDGWNGFVFRHHPLQDYNPATYQMFGRYSQVKDFYAALFQLQGAGKLRVVEKFLISSVEKFLKDPSLVQKFSQNSLTFYQEKFNPKKSAAALEKILLEAIPAQK